METIDWKCGFASALTKLYVKVRYVGRDCFMLITWVMHGEKCKKRYKTLKVVVPPHIN